jgi:hypothetical protein
VSPARYELGICIPGEGELGSSLEVTSNQGTILVTLIMEVIRSSEMSVLTRVTLRNILEDGILHVSDSLDVPS